MALPHSSFEHPDHVDQPARESIEVRVATIIPKDVRIQKKKHSQITKAL